MPRRSCRNLPCANLSVVKSFRYWLLVFLAVLLPIKAAMAAAMLCPPAGIGMQGQLRVTLHDGTAEVGVTHEHRAHEHGSAAFGDEVQTAPHDQCNFCSAFCSVTPLVSGLPSFLPPPAHPAALFPDFSAPPPSFLSDGQERPPRTI